MGYGKWDKRTGRLARRLAPVAGIAAIIGGVIAIAPLQEVPIVNAATASMETAAVQSVNQPVVGVQDSWVSASCWSDPYRALLPGEIDHKHKHKVNGKMVPYQDNSVPAVDNPNWGNLGISTVRFSPTWDIALPLKDLAGRDRTAIRIERRCFGYWLDRLAIYHVSAEIAVKPDYCYKNNAGCPDTQTGQVVIPALSEYQAAMRAFFIAYPQIKVIAPWGEPDFQPGKPVSTKAKPHPKAEPPFRIGGIHGANFGHANCAPRAAVDNCGPKLAAAMWITVRKLCKDCTVIAGDFGGFGPQDHAYLKPYNTYLKVRGYHPAVWGIHPYSDVKVQECQLAKKACKPENLGTCKAGTLVACFARWLKIDHYDQHTRIWLDEVSSFFSPGKGWSRQVQAEGASYLLLKLPKVTAPGAPVVTRIYYLRFAGRNNDALIVGGIPQCVYSAVAGRTTGLPGCALTPTATAAAAPYSSAAGTTYEIRDAADGLCLDANDKGASAGQNGDKVQLWNCYGGANQKWIPQFKSGQLAQLESAKYPGMCLNANNIGGLVNGRKVQLWNCYNALNELWNFGALVAGPQGGPLYLGGGTGQALALDADKYNLGNGDKVQVWAYYGGGSQLWSAVAA